jgi:hypothetical protein
VHCLERFHRVALGVRVASRCACYFWRLQPPDGLVDCGSVEARKDIVCSSGEEFVRGIVLTPRGSRRATLVECVIELPHLWVVSWCARSGQRLESLAQEPSRCWSTQRGLSWWQPSEPQAKNHRVNIIYSSRWFALLDHKHCIYIHIFIYIYIYIYIVLV